MKGLALHTWTLDTTPLAEILKLAPRTGWDAIELRRIDFDRAKDAGQTPEQLIDSVRASGLPVACVGAKFGWMFGDGPEKAALVGIMRDACRWAKALGCPMVMSPVDFTTGDLDRAAASTREMGDIAREQGVRLALEHQSQAPQLNRLEIVREIIATAGHPNVGLLADTYHIQRTGDVKAFEALPAEEIFYVQYSDVPADARPGYALDRLPPGKGVAPFREIFAILKSKGYAGYASYEAPNEPAWKRDPEEVAREAAAATRALLPR